MTTSTFTLTSLAPVEVHRMSSGTAWPNDNFYFPTPHSFQLCFYGASPGLSQPCFFLMGLGLIAVYLWLGFAIVEVRTCPHAVGSAHNPSGAPVCSENIGLGHKVHSIHSSPQEDNLTCPTQLVTTQIVHVTIVFTC